MNICGGVLIVGVGSSFQQRGAEMVNVLESDLLPNFQVTRQEGECRD